ncbi:MAG: hypothetical protein K2I64_04975 [Muribaculaceae bacterium]|nr:hypothetical protein [Muribaculaceae bacterium]
MNFSLFKDTYLINMMEIAGATLPFITAGYLFNKTILYIAAAVGGLTLAGAAVRAGVCMRRPEKIVETSILDKIVKDSSFAYSIAICNLFTMAAGLKSSAGFVLSGFLLLGAIASALADRRKT